MLEDVGVGEIASELVGEDVIDGVGVLVDVFDGVGVIVAVFDVQKTQEQRFTIPEIQSLISHYKNKIEHVHPTGNRGDSKIAKAKKSTPAKRPNRNTR